MRRLFATVLSLLTAVMLMAQGIPYIQNFTALEYKAHNQNFDICTSDDGTIYVANFEGLLYYDNTSWRILHTPGVTRLTAVFCDSRGTVWTGGYNFIGYTEHDQSGSIRLHELDSYNVFKGEVQWIWEDDEKIFFKASNNKIFSIQHNKVALEENAKLPTTGFSVLIEKAHITQIQELEDGMKAISTEGNGIIITNKDNQELFRITSENGLCSDNVSHITYNKHGIIWGATDNGIFAIAFPSIYTHITSSEGLKNEVLSIEKMNNRLYVGTLSGLYVMKGKRFEPVPGITHACWQLKLKDSSTLLAVTADGVYSISDNNSVRQLTTANTLSIMFDKQGFYSGEIDGIYYNTAQGRKYVSNVEKVVNIMTDSIGTIWAETLNGKIWKSFEPYADSEKDLHTLVKYKEQVLSISSEATKPFPYPAFSYNDSKNEVLWLTNNKNKGLYAFKNDEPEKHLTTMVYPLAHHS